MQARHRRPDMQALLTGLTVLPLLVAGVCLKGEPARQQLVLKRSVDLQTWETVAITPSMLTVDGALQLDAELPVFYRMDIQAVAPPGPGEFVLIPAGSFQMGDAFAEEASAERPVHGVYTSAFYLQSTEVTKGQWDSIRAWAMASGLGYSDLPAGGGKGPEHPVHSVSWYDAVKWLNAWSEKEGLNPVYKVGGEVMRSGTQIPAINNSANGYRLPTEAEWERAARGGLNGKRFPWGDTITHSDANYFVFSTDGINNVYSYDLSPTKGNHPVHNDGVQPYTSPVGWFAANGHGLYDMTGNVAEWCADWYSDDYYSSSPAVDPPGPGSGTTRVARGGRWNINASYCRVAARGNFSPNMSLNSIGFRAARSQ